jgi:hypothetical protein
MPISSQSLFHFTRSLDVVEKILTEGFKVGYCREEHTLNGVRTLCYVPMISFCEIPLSQVKEHIFKYGRYGVGLTREWARSNRLNPVIYLQHDSFLTEDIQKATHFFIAQSRDRIESISEEHFSAIKSLAQLISYTKNYEGTLSRKNETIENYRFSDEREWRFVPTHPSILTVMSEETFATDLGQRLKADITDGFRMPVGPSDISYLIVSSEDELEKIIAAVKARNGKVDVAQIDRLLTRIVTVEQLERDF